MLMKQFLLLEKYKNENKNEKLANIITKITKIKNANNNNKKYKQYTLTKDESKIMIETKLKVKYPNLKTDNFHFVNGGELKNISSTKLRLNLKKLLTRNKNPTKYKNKIKKLTKKNGIILKQVLNLLLENKNAKKRYGPSS